VPPSSDQGIASAARSLAGQSLAGMHAVVTGASRGIGAATARHLAMRGAAVSLLARSMDALRALEEELPDSAAFACDVTDRDSIRRAFAGAGDRGAIDILVNNAGAAESAPFLKSDAAMFRRMFAVNVESAVHCMQAVLPTMIKTGSGRVVNIASTSGVTGYAYVAAYAAAKHALVGLTRSLALEFAKSGVTVNAVCPGFTDTDIVRNSVETIVAKTGRSGEQALAELTRHNPQGRLVQPEEVAAAVGWLCLPESRSVTGQSIIIAGGELN
jgi:NAD(P)-dependent dehydrogenase (short-subunit alcohol dehydrogenase family)